MYLYLKAIHIIFIVTWFAGLFYIPRLFIYNTEANEKPAMIKEALQEQFGIMMKRLWYGITWPSAILTLVFGIWVLFESGLNNILFKEGGKMVIDKTGIRILSLLISFFIAGDNAPGIKRSV